MFGSDKAGPHSSQSSSQGRLSQGHGHPPIRTSFGQATDTKQCNIGILSQVLEGEEPINSRDAAGFIPTTPTKVGFRLDSDVHTREDVHQESKQKANNVSVECRLEGEHSK